MTAAMPNGSVALALDLLGQFWGWLRRPLMIERQRRELNQLSDHILKDIGLTRAGIDGISIHMIDRQPDTTRRGRGR
jgi:uncharacterized protein YjiS (DUF1127 family)